LAGLFKNAEIALDSLSIWYSSLLFFIVPVKGGSTLANRVEML